MHGYRLTSFGDFSKWQLITVRYRKDTDELRWSYANEKAWKVFRQGKTEYPDGAVFAKQGFHEVPDPDFSSSAVPGHTARIQFMVKNKRKFASTGGWGYLIFDGEGKVLAKNPVTDSVACHACHQLVERKGYIFSDYIHRGTGVNPWPRATNNNRGHAAFSSGITFVTDLKSALPAKISSHIPSKWTSVDILHAGKVNKYSFTGTTHELMPLLLDQAKKEKRPIVFYSEDLVHYTLIVPSNEECQSKSSFQVIRSPESIEQKPTEQIICW
jgi:hypothetical protein